MPPLPESSSGANLGKSTNPNSPQYSPQSAGATDETGFVPFESDVLPDSPAESSGATTSSSDPTGRKQLAEPSPGRSRPVAAPRPTTPPPQSDYQPVWKQAERAKQWGSLGKVRPWRLIAAQIFTAIALFWLVQQLIYLPLSQPPLWLSRIPGLFFQYRPIRPLEWSLAIAFAVLLLTSRWLMDALLMGLYGMKSLSLEALGESSPETVRSLKRFCQKRRVGVPALGRLPDRAPMIFTYGLLPRFSRIVVSQGLLDQLQDGEIASLIAGEIGHLSCFTVPLMTLLLLLLQIPYTLYCLIADWGNRQSSAVLRAVAIAFSSLAYGIFWLLRWTGLWFSRVRLFYSDRVAVELTGNPNGYTRGLLKSAIGMATDLQHQGKTTYLLEGLELAMPLGYRAAISLGSLFPHAPLEPMLEQERSNPYRYWLAISDAHPPTGDRLTQLMLYARYWRLAPELNLKLPENTLNRPTQVVLTAQQWRRLIFQGAPYFGCGFGLAIVWAFYAIGWAADRLRLPAFSWMYSDPSLMTALPLIGLSLGIFLRTNGFFPDFQFSRTSSDPPFLPDLLKIQAALPSDRQPVQLSGKLLGRPAVANRLNQDLWLHTPTGILRLHCTSPLGPISDLFPQEVRPTDLLNQDLTASGWFRRGTIPWMDVDTLRSPSGRTHRSHHPVWGVIIAVLAATWGIFRLLRGGL